MWLIDTATLELREFVTSTDVKYAILSHTWNDEEFLFRDMMSIPPDARKQKSGWAKVLQTCRLAETEGIGYAWIDTCCINKSSSAELSESINSMFQWYADAQVCYVFLEDLDPEEPMETGLARCRWITRGWTLQELIAPEDVQFFDCGWVKRGSKSGLVDTLEACTRIPSQLLQRTSRVDMMSVAEKMSWASHRETTRVEDTAYCLMGIFNVNMPLLYGEGAKAFRRLQEEIIKQTGDLSIFAWDDAALREHDFISVLAPSPAPFSGMSPYAGKPLVGDRSMSVTGKGVEISGHLTMTAWKAPKSHIDFYSLSLGRRNPGHYDIADGVFLRKIGPNLFHRQGRLPLAQVNMSNVREYFTATDFSILVDDSTMRPASSLASSFRQACIHIPSDIDIKSVRPEVLWDITDRVFLQNRSTKASFFMVLAVRLQVVVGSTPVEIVVLVDSRERHQEPTCHVFEAAKLERQVKYIFGRRHRNEFLHWEDLELHMPEILETKSTVEIRVGAVSKCIRAGLRKVIVDTISPKSGISCLALDQTDIPRP